MPIFNSPDKKRANPAPNQSFFQNYTSHLQVIGVEAEDILTRVNQQESFAMRLKVFAEEIPKRINILKNLRDGHDYMDEVLGTIVLPLLGTAASISALVFAIYEGAQALLIEIGLMDKDGDDHGEIAKDVLTIATLSFVVAVVSLLKSAISLLTRPLATMINSWQPQDKERFSDDNAMKNQ